jgi:hypothetical protein
MMQNSYPGRSVVDMVQLGICVAYALFVAIMITALVLLSRRPDFLDFGTHPDSSAQVATFVTWFIFLAASIVVLCFGSMVWKLLSAQLFILDVTFIFTGLLACGEVIILSIVIASCSAYGACGSFSGPPSSPNAEIVVMLVLSILICLLMVCLACTTLSSATQINVQCPPPPSEPTGDACNRPGSMLEEMTAWNMYEVMKYAIYFLVILTFLFLLALLGIMVSILNSHPHFTSPTSATDAIKELIAWIVGLFIAHTFPPAGIALGYSFRKWYVTAIGTGLGFLGALLVFILETIVIADCASYNFCSKTAPMSSNVAFVWLYVLGVFTMVALLIAFILSAYLSWYYDSGKAAVEKKA